MLRSIASTLLFLVPLAWSGCSDEETSGTGAAGPSSTGAAGSGSGASGGTAGASTGGGTTSGGGMAGGGVGGAAGGAGGASGGTGGGGSGSGGAPDGSMSFFLTSIGNGVDGGDYGGLVGADARCQQLAGGQGSVKTWFAYLSTHPSAGGGGNPVDARDRIGQGPWFNFSGAMVALDVGGLHQNGIDSTLVLDELGAGVPAGEHDVLTGSQQDGTAWPSFPNNPNGPSPTCANWTSNGDGSYAYVGHADWSDPNTIGNPVWNASHDTTCSQAGLASTAGVGRLYCFAID